MTRGHHSRKRHARGRKHKRSMSKHKSMRKHKRSMSKRKSRHGRKSRRRHKTRKMARGDARPPGDSPDVRPRDMQRNENMDFPDSTALDTWRGYNRNNYSRAQWNAHISAIVDAIEDDELDQDSTTQAEYADAYREMSGR